MNDDELISRLERMLPEELTPEELALLRSRAAASPAVREALWRWLQFEEVMAGGLSRYRVPIELVLAKAAAAGTPVNGLLGRLLGWGLAGLAVAALSFSLYLATRPRQPQPVLAAGAQPAAPAPAKRVTQQGPPLAGKEKPAVASMAATGSESKRRPPRPPGGVQTTEASPSDPPLGPPGIDPRRPGRQVSGEVPRLVAARIFATDGGLRSFAELSAQLAVVEGRIQPLAEKDDQGLLLEGRARWQGPWPAGQALRLGLLEHHGLELWIEGDAGGLVLRYYEYPEPSWAAYLVAPEEVAEGAGLAAGRRWTALAALDNGRLARSGRGPIDLVWRAGRLEMQRGDVLLLSAPLAGPPDRLTLAGRAKLQSADVLPAVTPLQEEEPLRYLPADTPAAAWDWRPTAPTAMRTAAEGLIELAGQTRTERAAVPIERPGLSMLTFEIVSPQAGTGIFLADAANRPLWHVGFFAEPRHGLVCATTASVESGSVRQMDPGTLPTALASEQTWLRVVSGVRGWQAYISTDGHWWSRLPGSFTPLGSPVVRAGIYSLPGRVLRLRRFQTHVPDELLSLAPAALYEQTPVWSDVADWRNWQTQAVLSLPEGSDADDWFAACALKTLAQGAAPEVAPHLVLLLADRVASLGPPAVLRWRQLHGLALLCGGGDEEITQRLARAYRRVAEELALRGEPLSPTAWRAVCMAAPIAGLDLLDAPLWRTTALAMAARGEADALEELVLQAAFFAASLDRPSPLAAMASGGGHPLVDGPGREEANLLAELAESLQLGAYRDACQIISSSTPQLVGGLLPDAADPLLRVSLTTAVANAMQQHSDLRAAMRRHFGQVARLRVNRAMEEQDEAAAEAATVQFYGTEAAATAHIWLGDRALAAGNLAQARGHYRAAFGQAEGGARRTAAAMLRLAAALQGRDEGEPPQAPVIYAGAELAPDEFEALVAELRTAHQNQHGNPARGGGASTQTAQPAGQEGSASLPAFASSHAVGPIYRVPMSAQDAAVLLGNRGDRPQDFTPAGLASRLCVASHGPHLLLKTATMLHLLNEDGTLRWSASLGEDAGDLAGLPGVPLDLGDAICCAHRLASGAELVLHDAATGQETWRTATGGAICSNAIWAEQTLYGLTKRLTPDGFLELCLAVFDPGSGALLREQSLVQFEPVLPEPLWGQCLLAADRLVVSAEGCALCCDMSGRVLWLRKLPWLPPQWRQPVEASIPAPVVVAPTQAWTLEEQLWLAYPEGGLHCCELDTGRLAWQQDLPETFEIAGVAGETLVLRGVERLYGLDRRDGRLLWQSQIRDREAAMWCEGTYVVGGVLQPLAGGRSRPAWQWIDAATGRKQACTPIIGLPLAPMSSVWLGPAFRWNQRVWIPFATADGRELALAAIAPGAESAKLGGDDVTGPLPLAASRLSESVEDVLPGWHWLDGPEDAHTGLVSELHGADNVLVTLADPQRPTRLAALAAIPQGRACYLQLQWSQPVPARWRLVIRTTEETLHEQTIEATASGWQTLKLDLGRFAGRKLPLVLEQHALDGGAAYVAWKACRFVEED